MELPDELEELHGYQVQLESIAAADKLESRRHPTTFEAPSRVGMENIG